MQVTIKQATERPIDIISQATGISRGKNDVSYRRVANCFKVDHMSVFEHAYITFEIKGISRACSHQLVRHRMASFVQESQRYTKIDTDTDWYVTPPDILNDAEGKPYFECMMYVCANAYLSELKNGIKPEDARYFLPEACKTNLVMTMNLREFYHFLDLRMDEAAQWEIRELASRMCEAARKLNDQWEWLMELRTER